MDLPAQAPHLFTEIIPDLVSSLGLKNFLTLSYFARLNGSTIKYEAFRDAVRKLQWVEMALQQARHTHDVLKNLEVDDNILLDPVAQLNFSKSVFEVIVYGKSSLDSLAQFLTKFCALPTEPTGADFKWAPFREVLI
jgi:hypothetical protein